MMKISLRKHKYWIVFIGLYFVYLSGHFIDIMDIDAAQYAGISAEMSRTNEFLEVYYRGQDYLDKPPLLFWISSLSFKLFGVSNWAFRIFPVLLSLLGIWATFKLTLLYYNRQTALYAALIWGSCQAFFLMNHDIRTDNTLTTFVIVAIWQLMVFIQFNTFKSLFWAFFAIGLAMLSKGPVGVIAPAMAVGSHVLLTRNWKIIWKWQWLLGVLITAIVLLPMNIGLYTQFDAQPQKVIPYLDQNNVSGLRFFYWTQSFGRITGESQWDNDAGIFFQLNAYLWSFLPWTVLGVAAYIWHGLRIVKSQFNNTASFIKNSIPEAFSWGGVTLLFFAMSLSAYQLPHYSYPAYPLLAIITAHFIHSMFDLHLFVSSFKSSLYIIQSFILFFLWIGLWIVFLVFFPFQSYLLWIVLGFVQLGFVYIFIVKKISKSIFSASLYTIISINFLLNIQFYPQILKYQAGSQAGKYLKEKNIPMSQVYCLSVAPFSLDMYSGVSAKVLDSFESIYHLPSGNYYIYTSEQGYQNLSNTSINVAIVKKFDDYPITNLSLDFLMPNTRSKVVGVSYLLNIVVPSN